MPRPDLDPAMREQAIRWEIPLDRLPPARVLARDARLKDLANNPVYWILMRRNSRRSSRARSGKSLARAILFGLGAFAGVCLLLFILLRNAGRGIDSLFILMMMVASEVGTRSLSLRISARGFLSEESHIGKDWAATPHQPEDLAVGVWGAMISTRRLRMAGGVYAPIAILLGALHFWIDPPGSRELLFLFLAGYLLVAGIEVCTAKGSPHDALAAAARELEGDYDADRKAVSDSALRGLGEALLVGIPAMIVYSVFAMFLGRPLLGALGFGAVGWIVGAFLAWDDRNNADGRYRNLIEAARRRLRWNAAEWEKAEEDMKPKF
jgi:hypothetical protein